MMVPTVQNNTAQEKGPLRAVEKKSDLICKLKYCNTLPDIPFDLQFLPYPFDVKKFAQYKPTSLEKQLQPYNEEEEAKAEEVAKKTMQVSDSDVSHDDEERLATSYTKHVNGEIVDGGKKKNNKCPRAASEVNSDSDTSEI